MRRAILGLVFAACTSQSASTPASEAVDTGAAPDTAGTDTGGADTAEGTPLEVKNVETVECVGDTGGSDCNGERMGMDAEDLGTDGVKVQDWGVYVGCGSVAVSARAVEPEIHVTYTVTGDADCSCMHLIEYRIHDVPPGEWRIEAKKHHARVTVGEADTAEP